jgi:hypothetical protein
VAAVAVAVARLLPVAQVLRLDNPLVINLRGLMVPQALPPVVV